MKIVQVLMAMAYGDAIGNDVLALYNALEDEGYETAIYAEVIDKRLKSKEYSVGKKYKIDEVKKMPALDKDDVLLYHLSTGTPLNFNIHKKGGRLVVIYHNVTPAEFFDGVNRKAYVQCREGRKGLKYLADKAEYCIADSEYNRQEMLEAGYKCKVDVLPILIPFDDYKQTPDAKVLAKYKDDEYTNIVFTGRLAPNKKQEDVISAFYMYQKYYNPKSRLFLVGSSIGIENYCGKLKRYANKLGAKDVIFTGHIRFAQILGFFDVADVFLCMSEHEGFCVPIVEAMLFETPIVAYNSSAVGDTMGEGGLLLDSKDPLEVAGVIDYLVRNKELQDTIIQNQKKRLEDFEHSKIKKQFLQYMKEFIGN